MAAEGAVAADAVRARSATHVVDEAGSVRTDEGLPLHAVELHALRALFWSTNGPGWRRQRGWSALLVGQPPGLEVDVGADGLVQRRRFVPRRRENPVAELQAAAGDSDPCLDRWEGVLCLDGHVMSLALPNNLLQGTLPAALGNLVHLRALVLEHNLLRGPLPPQLEQLAKLEFASLNDNQLQGPLDAAVFGAMPALRWLALHNNELQGATDLTWICAAHHMRGLTLSNNHGLSGELPSARCAARLQAMQLSMLNTAIGG